MTFTAFIKKQNERDDSLGDFARDFTYIIDNSLLYPEHRGTEEVTSETLYGHYRFLPDNVKSRDYIMEALCKLWQEWLGHKHIGLKFGEPNRGIVYVFKLEGKENIYKIGRTTKTPEERMLAVSRAERAELSLYDWIEVDHFDIIEKELHTVFKQQQVAREWFEVNKEEIDKAIYLYSLSDESSVMNSEQLNEEEIT